MNQTIMRIILPVGVIFMAIGIAFGFNKWDDGTLVFYSGHKKIGLNCIDTNVMCTAEGGTIICKDASKNTLYKYIGATNCPEQLWRPSPH